MKKILLTCIVLLLVEGADGQVFRYPVSSVYISAVQYSPVFTGPFSPFLNPVTLSLRKGFRLAAYAEKKYSVGALNLVALSGAVSNENSGVGIRVQYFGNPSYHETTLGVAYGKWLGKFGAGVLFNYREYKVRGADRIRLPDVGISLIYRLTSNVMAGLSIVNPPVFSSVSPGGRENPAPSYRFGIGYDISPQVYIGVEWIKEWGKPVQVMPLLHYRFAEHFDCHAGVAASTGEYFLAASWKFEKARVSLTFVQHTILGITPGFLFDFYDSGKAVVK